MAVSIPSFVSACSPASGYRFRLSVDWLREVVELASQVKRTPGRYSQALAGRYLTLLFEKPSLRTRLTFELAMKQLGGDSVTSTGLVGEREPVKDIARNLDRWTHGIVARVFAQDTVDELAKWAAVPVINALSDRFHPCQALADVQTLKEHFGRLDGLKLAFVGDGNNVVNSLMITATRMGVHVAVAAPRGYEPDARIVAQGERAGVRSPAIPRTLSRARMRIIPTFGPAWDRKTRRRRGLACLRRFR